MPAPSRIVIATRESALALWQARFVESELARIHPGSTVSILPMTTRGDQILDRSLSKVGGKGLFVKELENALADGRAGIAVHSMKDVPMSMPAGFVIGAITARADPRDAFVSSRHESLRSLPAGARVGTSSLRREAQLRARFPHLVVGPLRGNVQTRLRKLDEGEYDAIILAAAGLERLGLGGRIRGHLSVDESLPAPGQGALGIECLESRTDLQHAVQPLEDATSAAAVRAERTVSRLLGGSCQVPLGAYAEVAGPSLRLRAFVALPDGSRFLSTQVQGDAGHPEALGEEAAQALRSQGADAILATLAER